MGYQILALGDKLSSTALAEFGAKAIGIKEVVYHLDVILNLENFFGFIGQVLRNSRDRVGGCY